MNTLSNTAYKYCGLIKVDNIDSKFKFLEILFEERILVLSFRTGVKGIQSNWWNIPFHLSSAAS